MCCNFAVAKNVVQNVEHGFVAYAWTARELAAEVGVCHKTVLHILHDILGYRKIAAHWVPRTLSEHMMMEFVANKCCCFLLSVGRR